MKALVVCLALLSAPARAAEAPSLVVSGPSGKTVTLGVPELGKLAVRDVQVTDPHSKQPARYRGVALPILLALVGAPLGDALRGPALAARVEVSAADGYRAVFSLAELDAGVGNTDALVAFEADGKPLAESAGPFRIVVPTDKRGARWVRQVTAIRVVQPPP